MEKITKGKHPKGLMVLFFTEMWERFGFYLMIGILWLYMREDLSSQFPGMGFQKAKADDIIGTYLALVYLTPFIGGMLADRVLGYRKSVFIGGILMAIGYLGLAIHSETAFYISLLFVILGNGLFKPNISALVGNLYNSPKYKDLKDAGYNIFYMGINIGAFACNFIAAFLRINYGWGWAFAAAGIGMLIGVVWLAAGQTEDIKKADQITKRAPEEESLGSIFAKLLLPAFAVGALGWFVPQLLLGHTLFGSKPSVDAFVFFCIPLIIFYYNIYKTAAAHEKQPIAALLSVMGVVVIFWAIFHQNSSALTNWAESYTDRQVSGNLEDGLKALSLNEEKSSAPGVYVLTDEHFEPIKDDSGNKQMVVSMEPYFRNYDTAAHADNLPKDDIKYYAANDSSQEEVYRNSPYFVEYNNLPDGVADKPFEVTVTSDTTFILNVPIDGVKPQEGKFGETVKLEKNFRITLDKNPDSMVVAQAINKDHYEFVVKNDKINLVTTELFQSVNPGFIILFTPLVVGFFRFLRRRKREPSTPAKIGYGLLITALSALVMVGAVYASDNGAIKVGASWLFGSYAVVTIGELFLSPMGLSLVSKLSPKRITALMMGGWFLSTAIGNKLSGVLASMWSFYDNKAMFFVTNSALAMISVIGIFILLPWLRRVVTEYGESNISEEEED